MSNNAQRGAQAEFKAIQQEIHRLLEFFRSKSVKIEGLEEFHADMQSVVDKFPTTPLNKEVVMDFKRRSMSIVDKIPASVRDRADLKDAVKKLRELAESLQALADKC